MNETRRPHTLALLTLSALLAAPCLSACNRDTDSGEDAAGLLDSQTALDAGQRDALPTDTNSLDSGSDMDAGVPSQVPVVAGCGIFPPDNMWNTPIDQAPVHPRWEEYLDSIGRDTTMHPDFGTTWNGVPIGIPYDVVPPDQPLVDVTFDYADESDPGPYPIPPDATIEGGPDSQGDRHVLLLQQGTCILYELYDAWPQADGTWHAGSGAIWHLDENEVRPAGWTSADAAGLAIFPGLVKWEEVNEDGEIRHAIRVTLSNIQRAYIPPASHSDGRCGQDPSCPPMGLRLRLRQDFDESGFPPEVQVILRAMKKYGLVVADTGGDLYVSGVPDPRWDDDALHTLHNVTAADLEAVYTGDAVPY